MKKIVNFVLSFVFVLCYISIDIDAQTKKFNSCTTTDLCIPLRNCPSLFTLISKGKNLTSDDRLHLSRSQCGYDDSQPLVCCPAKNATTVDDIIPSPPVCGIVLLDHGPIRGLVPALDESPWMALLEYSKPNNEKGFHCVGVLISKRYVLTAAHCLRGKDIPGTWNLTGVRLGEHNLLTDPDCVNTYVSVDCAEPVVDIPISETIIHELYNPLSINVINDIALIRLASEVVYSDFVKPICLPRSVDDKHTNYDNRRLDDGGWNKETNEYSEKLMDRIHMVNNSQCNTIYNTAGITVHDTQLCGTPGSLTFKSCQGIPGSPLFTIDRKSVYNNFHVVGVESFGPPVCGEKGWPIVYTRISNYVDWIVSKMYV